MHRYAPCCIAAVLGTGAVVHGQTTMAELVAAEIRAACDGIGVRIDGGGSTSVVNDALTDRANVQDLAEHLISLQRQTVADLEQAKKEAQSPEYKAKRDRAIDDLQRAVKRWDDARDHATREEIHEENRARQVLDKAQRDWLTKKNAFDSFAQGELQNIGHGSRVLSSALEQAESSQRAVQDLVYERHDLEQQLGWGDRLMGGVITQSLEQNMERIRGHYTTVQQHVASVNGALQDLGKEPIAGMNALGDDTDVSSIESILGSVRSSLDGATRSLMTQHQELEKKRVARDAAAETLNQAKAKLREAKQARLEAQQNWEPPAHLIELVIDAQKAVDEIGNPWLEASEMARAVNEYVAGVQDCIDAARGSWGTSVFRGATCGGTWDYKCNGVDWDGRPTAHAHSGTFTLQVVAVNYGDAGSNAVSDDVAEVSARFVDASHPDNPWTVSGYLQPTMRDMAGNITQSKLLIAHHDRSEGLDTSLEFSGTLYGDPLGGGTLTGQGRVKIRDVGYGDDATNETCEGTWKTN